MFYVSSSVDRRRVSTAWLAARIGDPNVRVLAVVRAGDRVTDGVPGAARLDVTTLLDALGRPLPPPLFAAAMHEAGVDNLSLVVLYDRGDGSLAGAVAAAIVACGHAQVSVLVGGLARWRAELRAVAPHRTPVRSRVGYTARAPSFARAAEVGPSRIAEPATARVAVSSRAPTRRAG